jgi:hypothetical protein
MQQLRYAVGGALVMAAASTVGDFIWATSITEHRPLYGMIHGMLLFLCLGLCLGVASRKTVMGAIGGMLAGFLGAGGFYELWRFFGYGAMFVSWIGVWVGLGLWNGIVLERRVGIGEVLVRGGIAAIGSAIAFYAISGIWFPFRPEGWDYAIHFAAWTVAFLPGLAALLVRPATHAASFS